MTAIVTDVHYRMSLAVIRDLVESGVFVVACESDRHRGDKRAPALGMFSKYVKETRFLPEDGYLDALFSLCEEIFRRDGHKPALMPVGAGTIAALAPIDVQVRFAAVCGLCAPTQDMLALFNDKSAVAALAAQVGVPVPKTYETNGSEQSFQGLCPVVIKPAEGEKFGLTASKRYLIAQTPAAAAKAYRHFSDICGVPPIVQQYLPGDSLGCSVLAKDGEILHALCHRRIRVYPVSGGPSSCCQAVDAPQLEAYAQKLIRAANYTGVAMVEFKQDGRGQPLLLEINPRVWGSYPLSRVVRDGFSRRWFGVSAGQNSFTGPSGETKRYKRRMRFLTSDLAAAKGYFGRKQFGKAFSVFFDCFNPRVRDGLFEWRDMRPAIAYYKSFLAGGRDDV